jgi:hypothetical protein
MDGTQPTDSWLRLTGRRGARDDFVTAGGNSAPPDPASAATRRSGCRGGDGLHTGSAYHGEGVGGWLDRTGDSRTDGNQGAALPEADI